MTFHSTIHAGQNLPQHPYQLLDTSYVIVIPRTISYTPHGALYTEQNPVKVVCDVEGKAVQAGMFANSGSEDTNMQTQGGLRQLTDFRILARQWPGNIASLIWLPLPKLQWPDGQPGGNLLESVGQPVFMTNGTDEAMHVQQMASLIADHEFNTNPNIRRYGFKQPVLDDGGQHDHSS